MKRVFVSYSWDSEPHKAWVLMLAEQLEREPDLSIRLDRWHLTPGATLAEYMEEIASVDSCVVIGTCAYAAKANQRSAGVGYEAQIITAQILAGTPGQTFVPIIREGGFATALPTFLQGRLSIDFRKDEVFSASLEQLLRALLNKPFHTPPPKGEPTIFRPHRHSDRALGNENRAGCSISVVPVPNFCWVYLGAENHKPNERFALRINIRLMSSLPVVVTGISGLLYAEDGCPCLPGEAEIHINEQPIPTLRDFRTFIKPVRCDPDGLLITYWSRARPPLREQVPADCEFGDLALTIKTLDGTEEKEFTYMFRFEPGGNMTPIHKKRDERYLSDAALATLHQNNIIDSNTLGQILRLDPCRRYQLSTFYSQQQKELSSSYGERLEFIKLLENTKELEQNFKVQNS